MEASAQERLKRAELAHDKEISMLSMNVLNIADKLQGKAVYTEKVYLYVCIYVCICMYAKVIVCMHICMYLYVCKGNCMHAYMYVFVCMHALV